MQLIVQLLSAGLGVLTRMKDLRMRMLKRRMPGMRKQKKSVSGAADLETPVIYLTQDKVIKLTVVIKQAVGPLHAHYSVRAGLCEPFLQTWYVLYPAKPEVVGRDLPVCLADIDTFHYFRLRRTGQAEM